MAGKGRKGEKMEEVMTDFQFIAILKMMIDILDGSKDIDEAKDKIQDIIDEKTKKKDSE